MVRNLMMLFRVSGKAVVRFNRDDGGAMAGYIAYISLLSLFPFLIFATSLAGMMIGPEESDRVVAEMFRLLPEHIALTIQPVLREVLSQPRGGVITISATGAVWIASSGFEAFRIAFDRAYDATDRRPIWVTRGLSILFVFVATAVFILLGLVVIGGPLIRFLLREHLQWELPIAVPTLLYTVAAVVLAAFLLVLHRTLPARRLKTRELWPGVLATGAIWLSVASLFSVYLRYAPNYTVTYGALAGVIMTLLFFYVSGAAIIYGAALNATLADERAARRAEKERLRLVNDAAAKVD
jgi:membrane protein